MRILISSAGRRVGLLGCFRESFRRLGVCGCIVAADASPDAPALQFADSVRRTPPCDDPAFLPCLLEIVTRDRIDVVIPAIDPELAVYAAARGILARAGAQVVVSSPEAIAICADKRRTHRWLERHGFPVPAQQSLAAAFASPGARCFPARLPVPFPVIVKPRRGSGSVGVRRVGSHEELLAIARQAQAGGALQDHVIEEIAPGREHTINVLVGARRRSVAEVPHLRLEVRAGEVSKAVTVRHAGLMRLARSIAETLPGARGPLSIQCFLAADGAVLVTEINARFGGGYPLTHQAGARFTDWILQELRGRPAARCDDWTDNLTMLRYDREVFLPPPGAARATPDGPLLASAGQAG